MKPVKKLKSNKETTSKAMVQGLEFGAVAVAIAIIVLLPVVLNLDLIMTDPAEAYSSSNFRVLMGLSAILLATVLGLVALRRKALGVPVLVPALALLGVSALSALFSQDPWHSLFGDRYEGLLSLGASVLLFYALARCLNSALRVRIFLAAGVSAAVLVSIHGIVQRYGLDMITGWGNPWYTNFERSISTLGHPIALAAYLTLMMGATAALCFKKTSSSGWSYRVPWLSALAVIVACWIYTDTRAALLGAMVTLPVVLWFSHRRMGTTRPLLVPLVTLIGAIAIAVVAWAIFAHAIAGAVVASAGYAFSDLTLSTRIMNIRTIALLAAYLALLAIVLWLFKRGRRASRFWLVSLSVLIVTGIAVVTVVVIANIVANSPTPTDSATGSSTVEPNSQIRLYIWRDTMPMILDRPLLGYGPDNFREPFESYMSEDLTAALTYGPSQEVLAVDRAHSDLLQVAANTGLLGLAAYIWVFVSYFRNVYQRGGWPLIALSGAVLAYILQLQVGVASIVTNVALWSILGASVALMRIHDREQCSSAPNNQNSPETDSVEVALTNETSSRVGVYELGVVVIVVGVLAAIAIPTFLDQREKVLALQEARVKVNVQKAVAVYEQAKAGSETYLGDGVYTRTRSLYDAEGNLMFTPSGGVTITTATACGGDFVVEGESASVAGTSRYSYDSVTGTYTSSLYPDTSSYPDISGGLAGENMNPSRDVRFSIECDDTARDGLALALYSNGYADFKGRTDGTVQEVIFHASSNLNGDVTEPAILELTIDGASQGTLEIPGTTLSEHKFELPEPLEPGVHTFEVAFTNDYSDGSDTRDLYIDHLSFAEISTD